MNVDMELYKIFYFVATLGNITKAANELYISQPAVTMSIKKLEETLQVTLFSRTKKGVILTSEGKILYDYIKEVMENIKIAENKMENLKKLDTGTIKIGIGTTLTKHFLLPYLEEFHEKYPKISINIDTSMSTDIIDNLKNGKIDLAIIVSSDIPSKELSIEYEEEFKEAFIVNSKFKEKLNKKIKLEELANYPLILQPKNASTRKFLDNFMKENNIKLETTIELASYALITEFTKIGMGIGVMGLKFIENELKEKELFILETIPSLPSRKIFILTKKDYLPSFSTTKLIEIIKKKDK